MLDANRIIEACSLIDPVFLNSPQFLSEPLSDDLGCRVTCKVETLNPIRSFKGRGASLYVNRECASARPLVCASAGNFGQGLAYACRKAAIPLHVFLPVGANPLKVERIRGLGAEVHLMGSDFDSAKAAASDFASQNGLHFVEDGKEEAITEGAGTIGVELLRNGAEFDAVVLPLGNGALLNGVGAYIKSSSPQTRVVGVCAEGAPAMARSFNGRACISTDSVKTIADGIAVRQPVPEAVTLMNCFADEVLLVSDEQIITAMRAAKRHLGILVEPAGAAGLAAIAACRSRFASLRVATVLCGSNMTEEQMNSYRL